jgi:hypothetical protein
LKRHLKNAHVAKDATADDDDDGSSDEDDNDVKKSFSCSSCPKKVPNHARLFLLVFWTSAGPVARSG